MKKILQKGFTLAEIMVALGISSLVILVILQAQKSTVTNTGDIKQASEINNLILNLTTELSRVDSCQKNFQGLGITNPSILTPITTRRGAQLVKANTAYGSEIDIKIISTAAGTNPNQMVLTVNYQPHNKTALKFTIPLNVYFDSAGLIKTCFSDVRGIMIAAVASACKGDGATVVGASGSSIGSCEHNVRLQYSNATYVANTGAGNYLCPPGEFLYQMQADTASPYNYRTFKCQKFSIDSACGPWKYLQGINNDGTKNCLDIRTLFLGTPNTTGLMVLQGGVYRSFTLSCPAGTILQSITNQTPNCVNPRVNGNCPVNQYAKGVDGAGNPICTYSSNSNTCAAGTYITAIDTAGNVTCGSGTLPTSCASNQVMTGINAAGSVICSAMP